MTISVALWTLTAEIRTTAELMFRSATAMNLHSAMFRSNIRRLKSMHFVTSISLLTQERGLLW